MNGEPIAAIETNDAGQVRIAFQERGESGLDPPKNFSLRQMLP